MENFVNWSDERVLRECVRYGEEARKWRSRFLGLLPEVYRRKLYEKHGCSSVVEFAKKVGGVSEEQVSRVLNLEKSFQDKPNLHAALVSGETSMNKLARVASIATPENDEELVNLTNNLPMSALKTFVRDVRVVDHKVGNNSLFEQESLKLDKDVEKELLELQKKGIDVNGIVRDALRQREQRIQQEKESIAGRCTETDSRYIPSRTRKLLIQEHGTKCSITTCHKLSQQIHHTQRFSVAKTHNPHYLAPLCRGHHMLVHMADLKYAKKVRGRT